MLTITIILTMTFLTITISLGQSSEQLKADQKLVIFSLAADTKATINTSLAYMTPQKVAQKPYQNTFFIKNMEIGQRKNFKYYGY